ncbi:hypothetical protein C8J56DRAFT_881406 [Mycena floridula]|nr:hypothetical protein C8J56DRAFT_881406 [Mycena floridula]
MKSFTTLLGLAVLATSAFAQLVVNTPGAKSLVQCRPIQLSWSGGILSTFSRRDNPTGASLVDLGQQTGTTFTWTVNVAAGTSVDIQIRDSEGVIQNSAPVTVQPSKDSSCLATTY